MGDLCVLRLHSDRASFILDLHSVINEHIVALSVPFTVVFLVLRTARCSRTVLRSLCHDVFV